MRTRRVAPTELKLGVVAVFPVVAAKAGLFGLVGMGLGPFGARCQKEVGLPE